MNATIIQVVVPVLVSVISALLAVHLALRKFYQEKWFERKLAAYLAAIESLHHVRFAYAAWEDAWITERELPDEYNKSLNNKKREAESDLQKAIDIGEFLIAADAVAELQKFLRAMYGTRGRSGDPGDTYSEVCDLADAALLEMRRIAKADLAPPSRFGWRKGRFSN